MLCNAAGEPSSGGGGTAHVSFAVGTASGSTSVSLSTSSSREGASGTALTTAGGHQPVNLPAVLKDRIPSNLRPGSSRGPPPPVPPRSPKRVTGTAPSAAPAPPGSGKGDQSRTMEDMLQLVVVGFLLLRLGLLLVR